MVTVIPSMGGKTNHPDSETTMQILEYIALSPSCTVFELKKYVALPNMILNQGLRFLIAIDCIVESHGRYYTTQVGDDRYLNYAAEKGRGTNGPPSAKQRLDELMRGLKP